MEVEVTPKAADLISIIALLSQEADSLRERTGATRIQIMKRLFTREDLARGRDLCAKASETISGCVVVRIES